MHINQWYDHQRSLGAKITHIDLVRGCETCPHSDHVHRLYKSISINMSPLCVEKDFRARSHAYRTMVRSSQMTRCENQPLQLGARVRNMRSNAPK